MNINTNNGNSSSLSTLQCYAYKYVTSFSDILDLMEYKSKYSELIHMMFIAYCDFFFISI